MGRIQKKHRLNWTKILTWLAVLFVIVAFWGMVISWIWVATAEAGQVCTTHCDQLGEGTHCTTICSDY